MTGHAISDRDDTSTDTQPPFRFRTKAGNLRQLIGTVRSSTVLPLEIVTVAEWRRDSAACARSLEAAFGPSPIIVRSSAPGEDSVDESHAGEFHSVADVDVTDHEEVRAAVDEVIASYERDGAATIDDHEVLVQPMVPRVRMSGVVFTRDLERNGPYYVVNYDDETSRTDTVTAGGSTGHRVVRVWRGVDPASLDGDIGAVIRLARELEHVTGSDALDIEFAIGAGDLPYLLQVRPLARTKIQSLRRLDLRVDREVEQVKDFVREKLASKPGLHGRQGILGEMPDWNPAEIIGTHPKPLAHSLYRHLIMDRTWREARGLMGYRDPAPHQLLCVVGGHPYVDVRASFNSFLPAALPGPLAEKLVEHYLGRLREFPEFHDKVEFEILVSCLTFDFEAHEDRLVTHGFTRDETSTLREALRVLTDDVVTDRNKVLATLEADVTRLGQRRDQVLATHSSVHDVPMVVQQLLDDCVAYGTLPFSVFARCAFIGTSFLRSLVDRGIISEEESERYVRGIETVAGAFVDDLEACRAGGQAGRATFLATYGHLRPGTYDICSHTYAERPDVYLGFGSEDSSVPPAEGAAAAGGGHVQRDDADPVLDHLPPDARTPAAQLLAAQGFTFDLDELERFIGTSIQLRESVKFEFSKNLSIALDLLVEFGRYHGLSRQDLSFLRIQQLLELADENLAEDHIGALRASIERNRNRFEVTAALNLPDLIFSERDVDVVSVQARRPNFVGSSRVVAEAHRLTSVEELDDDALRDKIVLIENADPGYDWLFGKDIAGLVTKYGGAASHMAIRCAEFGLPAAIGCGEQIFDGLESASSILLDPGASEVVGYG